MVDGVGGAQPLAPVFVVLAAQKWIEGNEISDSVFNKAEINILAAIEDSEDHHLS